MRGDRRAIQAGFTLTELLVVLLLIGVFTGVMLAEMRGTFQDALLRSSARDIMSGLSIASSRAVSLNQPHAFEWNAAGKEFVVRATQGTERSSSETENLERKRLDERVTIEIRDPAQEPDPNAEPGPDSEDPRHNETREREVIQFYPDGTADAREIVLRDNNNGELVLRISPITGRVRVQEEEL